MNIEELLAENAALRAEIEGLRQRNEPELLQARLAAIVESTDDAVVSKNLDGIIRTWNVGAERIFGWKAEEVVGRPINVIIPPDHQDEEPQILARLRRGERIDHFETVRITKEGRLVDVSVTISPVRNAAGELVAASKIARDVTQQKQILRELKAAKDEAESANHAKDHFLMRLSHELRTPLTPVLAELSYLEASGTLPGSLAPRLAMVRRNVETEARLVDDLLDISRIANGKLQLHYEVVDLHQAVRSSMTMIHAGMEAQEQELVLGLRAAQHKTWGDPGRVQQILLNLLSNAVKFTPRGGQITVRSSNDAEGKTIRIEISDNGVGIAPEALPRLFQSFEQAGRGGQYGGLGLGLAISSTLAEIHNGKIRASSPGIDQGATFTLELPATTEPEQARRKGKNEAQASVTGTRVLLVEDHIDTRDVMARLLQGLGCSVQVAGSVREAIALGASGNFDVLLCDLGLPDGSGLDVMRQLRATTRIRGMALSGFGQENDVERSLAAGFEKHITKPINFIALQEAVLSLAG
ncbi:MAG TPA: ATP-binding protein [Terriglobales bacterium]|nr:ATP-binding protein [Terriglobales bacterium]